jgi:hypothetical protein
MHIRGTLATVALACALTLPGIAAAKDRAEGWANWIERVERIEAAMTSTGGASARLDSACTGVTRTVIGQGFQFPGWARALIQACTATQAAFHGSDYRKRSKSICKGLIDVSRQMGKATEVAESPRAHLVALRFSYELIALHNQVCMEVDHKR